MAAKLTPTVVSMGRKLSDGSFGSLDLFVSIQITYDTDTPSGDEKRQAAADGYRACATLLNNAMKAADMTDPIVSRIERFSGKPVVNQPAISRGGLPVDQDRPARG